MFNVRALLNKLRSRTPEEMLIELQELREAFDDATNSLQEQIEKLEARLEASYPDLQEKIGELESRIKAACMERGETIVGKNLQCVFTPEKVYNKISAPSVSIRPYKKG